MKVHDLPILDFYFVLIFSIRPVTSPSTIYQEIAYLSQYSSYSAYPFGLEEYY